MSNDDLSLMSHLADLVENLEAENASMREQLDSANGAHDFLRSVYNDETRPLHQRLEAAKAAIKHESPTLASVRVQRGTGLAERLERARTRAGLRSGKPTARQLLLTHQPGSMN
jgi:hypothetical protein